MALGEALGLGDAQHSFRLQDVSLDDGGEDNDDDGPFGGMGSRWWWRITEIFRRN